MKVRNLVRVNLQTILEIDVDRDCDSRPIRHSDIVDLVYSKYISLIHYATPNKPLSDCIVSSKFNVSVLAQYNARPNREGADIEYKD